MGRRLAVADAAGAADLDHRVGHGADPHALGVDLAHHAVDQEGAVVLDDLQSHQVQRTAVLAGGGHQPELGVGAAAALGEGPEVRRQRGKVAAGDAGELVLGAMLAQLLGELGLQRGQRLGAQRMGEGVAETVGGSGWRGGLGKAG